MKHFLELINTTLLENNFLFQQTLKIKLKFDKYFISFYIIR